MNLSFIFLDPHLIGETLVAHTDAVWDLAYHIDTDHLLSCSADGTCKLWNPSLKTPLIASYSSEGMISFTINSCFYYCCCCYVIMLLCYFVNIIIIIFIMVNYFINIIILLVI